MPRIVRFAFVSVLTLWLAACGTEPAEIPSAASGPLDPAATPQCSVQEADDIIGEIFPNRGLQNQARAKCSNILRQADRDLADAVEKTFDFLGQTLDFYDAGRLSSPSQGTLEQAIVDLFAALFGAIGVDGPTLTAEGIESGDIAFGFFGPSGGTLTVPSLHAAIHFHPGDLADDTWVTVSFINDPDPDTAGDCPFGFPVPFDCYPLFYDYSLVPESNLVGVPRIGQCVVEPPDPNAPPNSTVEARLRLASPDDANPGELIFWPLATAPGTVDCSDLETIALSPTDARDVLWTGLGPLQGLFHVGEAYANPGKLGASVSTFSPFAPTDPESGSIEVTVFDTSESTVSGADVEVVDTTTETVVATGLTDGNGEIVFSLPFGTYDVSASKGAAFSGTETVTLSSASPTAEVDLTLVSLDID